MKDTRVSDLFVSVVILLIGVGGIALSLGLPTAALGLGSGGFPRVVCACLIFLGLVQAALTCSRGFGGIKVQCSWASIRPVAEAAAAAILYVLLLRYAGFLLLTPVLLFVMMMLFGYRKYLTAVIISLTATGIIYVIFAKIFMIFLPECRLF